MRAVVDSLNIVYKSIRTECQRWSIAVGHQYCVIGGYHQLLTPYRIVAMVSSIIQVKLYGLQMCLRVAIINNRMLLHTLN